MFKGSILNAHHRYGNPVSDSEFNDWFDCDGRLVKVAAMKEALFHSGVSSNCRPCLWKFLFGIYPINSTKRDQRTIDLENRANYLALSQRWQILDKTLQIPDQELTISDHPSYLEHSEDEAETVDSSQQDPKVNKTSSENEDMVDLGDEQESLLRGSQLSKSGEICSRYHEGSMDNSSAVATSDKTVCDYSNGHVYSSTEHQLSGSENNIECQSNGESSLASTQVTTSVQYGDVCQAETEEVRTKRYGCDFIRNSSENLSKDDEALLKILDFPSRVYAARQPVQLETSYSKARRIILRDVARTDRNYPYFTHKRNLRKVHRILHTYAMFHPDVGYAQGMNDLLARFLVVTDSEVDSYWMFTHYMDKKREDFIEDTMMRKVAFVKKLVKEVDKELYTFFEHSDCHDYLFCHRWLLLDFKREFLFEDALRIFEVLNSQYLELNSDKALVETDKVIAKEFEMDAGETRSERSEVNLEFTFDVFVCVAILTMNSVDICQASDAAGIYGCLNGLSMNMKLNEVLSQAEELFYKYCRQNITRRFAELGF